MKRGYEKNQLAVTWTIGRLVSQLGAAPMSSLVVVTNLAVRFESKPIRNLAVLMSFPRKLLLDHERLMSGHPETDSRVILSFLQTRNE